MDEKKVEFRQGDVLLIKVDKEIPKDAHMVKPEKNRVILAHGEVTGHAHAIPAKAAVLYETMANTRLLEVTVPTQLIHEEHGAIDLDPGVYEVYRQVEYSPRDLRYVRD